MRNIEYKSTSAERDNDTRRLLYSQRKNLLAKLKREKDKDFPNFNRCLNIQIRINAIENDISDLDCCGL